MYTCSMGFHVGGVLILSLLMSRNCQYSLIPRLSLMRTAWCLSTYAQLRNRFSSFFSLSVVSESCRLSLSTINSHTKEVLSLMKSKNCLSSEMFLCRMSGKTNALAVNCCLQIYAPFFIFKCAFTPFDKFHSKPCFLVAIDHLPCNDPDERPATFK